MGIGIGRTGLAALMLFTGLAFGTAGAAAECEGGYRSHYGDELKQLRDTLANPDADPFDKLLAFEELVCSERAVVRAWAVRTGLATARDDMVRNQVLLDALMQQQRIDVEYPSVDGLSRPDREFASKRGGFDSFEVQFANREEGCLSFYSNRCLPSSSLFVFGDRVTIAYNQLVGEFRLGDDGVLTGFVRQGDASDHGRIPAVIRLF